MRLVSFVFAVGFVSSAFADSKLISCSNRNGKIELIESATAVQLVVEQRAEFGTLTGLLAEKDSGAWHRLSLRMPLMSGGSKKSCSVSGKDPLLVYCSGGSDPGELVEIAGPGSQASGEPTKVSLSGFVLQSFLETATLLNKKEELEEKKKLEFFITDYLFKTTSYRAGVSLRSSYGLEYDLSDCTTGDLRKDSK